MKKVSESKLKPCPFCGGAAEIKPELYGLNGYRIGCAFRATEYTCPGFIGFSACYWNEEMAITSWNRRAEIKGAAKLLTLSGKGGNHEQAS